jgi:hypothetical protein
VDRIKSALPAAQPGRSQLRTKRACCSERLTDQRHRFQRRILVFEYRGIKTVIVLDRIRV